MESRNSPVMELTRLDDCVYVCCGVGEGEEVKEV